MKIQRTVQTSADPAVVFDYLADFTTTTEWEPGTEKTVRLSGDGGVGTTYRNVSSFAGRTTEVQYEVTQLRAPSVIALRGENDSVIAHDRMEIEPDGEGSRVTYTAAFDLKGWRKVAAPLMIPALKKLGDDGAKGMKEALDRL